MDSNCGTFWKVRHFRGIEVERLQEFRFGASSDVPTEKQEVNKIRLDDIAEFELKVRCQRLRVGERTEGMSSQIRRLH